MLTESIVIGLLGGGVGLALAFGGVALLRTGAAGVLPRLDEVSVDGVVLAFTLLLAVLTGVLFGLVPSIQVAGGNLSSALRDEARGTVSTRSGGRTRGMLVVAELSLSLVLLVGASLLLQSFVRLNRVDTGFQTQGVLTANVALGGPAYSQPAAGLAFYDRLFERLRALPGVEQVAAGSNILLEELPWSAGFTVEGRPREPDAEQIELTIDAVTPGYFRAVGTPLLLGRDVSDGDRDGTLPVAIVNQAMVRRYWADGDPLGKRFKFGDEDSNSPWLTVIGVAGDARRTSQEQEARPSAYLPLRQLPVGSLLLILRTSGDPTALAQPLRAAVRSLDADVPLGEVKLLESILRDRLAQRRLMTVLAGIFTALAIGLALIGVYGVLSYAVAQSTREIGVRIALGANVSSVLGMVYRRVAGLLAAGLGLGVLTALLATRALTSLLFDVRALDPATFAVAPLLLAAVSLLACYIPARRATRVDPAVALRVEQ
jgi:putative ABC transport system permease protein